MRRALGLATLATALLAVDATAQSLREQCAVDLTMMCSQAAEAALTVRPHLVIAAAGGNPVSGTASTIGMRLPGSPRWSIAVRGTMARGDVPPLPPDAESETLSPWSINADAVVGLFNGVQLMPTVGGFASIDVLGSIGLLAAEDGPYTQDSRVTWGLGTRVGILRESFTAPGVSVSAMYRSVPDLESGTTMEVERQGVVSLRGTVGKRILGLGLTGGVGWDRGSGTIRVTYLEDGSTDAIVTVESDESWSRTSFFGNVSWTLLILNLSAELGWQGGGDAPAGAHDDAGSGSVFGGLAIRLAI